MTDVIKYENIKTKIATCQKTKVILFKDDDRFVALLNWLDELPMKARLKRLARIERLAQEGHALRRPEADLLTDKIYELRASLQGIHYRILYFFHGNVAAVVSHGIAKEGRVPPIEIARAVERRKKFESNPKKHTYEE